MAIFKKFKRVINDRKPDLLFTFKDKKTDLPFNLSSSSITVSFRVQKVGATNSLFEVTGTKIDSGIDGRVLFEFPASPLVSVVGRYELEVLIDFSGAQQTVFDKIQFDFRKELPAVA
jgi:hypothetical protein